MAIRGWQRRLATRGETTEAGRRLAAVRWEARGGVLGGIEGSEPRKHATRGTERNRHIVASRLAPYLEPWQAHDMIRGSACLAEHIVRQELCFGGSGGIRGAMATQA